MSWFYKDSAIWVFLSYSYLMNFLECWLIEIFRHFVSPLLRYSAKNHRMGLSERRRLADQACRTMPAKRLVGRSPYQL